MLFDWSGSPGLAGVVLSAFLSATLLPGSSEIVLSAYLAKAPHHAVSAVLLATVANTAGSMTNYGLGRLARQPAEHPRALVWVRRYGCWALLLAWLPAIGDALCVAAGWLRLPVWLCIFAVSLGKWARYVMIALIFV